MDTKFAQYTKVILDMLPHWFAIRKNSSESIGARFLNITGLKLDDLRYVLDYAYQQCYISTADINQVDFCYKAIVSMPLKVSEIDTVFAYGQGLKKAKDLKEFFGIDQNIKDKNLNYLDTYYLDVQRNIIYVRNKFNVDAIYENGYIEFEIKGVKYKQALIPHQVWNFFDEFGLLLNCPRINEEPNIEFKKRILDVFRNPSNSSKDGLINGIARELAIRTTLIWKDPTKDLELTDSMIVLNSIQVDRQYFDIDKIFITESDSILLKGFDTDKKNIEVTYVHGLEMHKLWNKNDYKLQKQLFTIDNKTKYNLEKYIDQMNAECPIFWDTFVWNEHYWDPNAYNVSGYGTVPTMLDGSIRGFKNYKP